MATAAGPHAGAHEGELVRRFTFKGSETLEWLVQRHGAAAAIFGLAAVVSGSCCAGRVATGALSAR